MFLLFQDGEIILNWWKTENLSKLTQTVDLFKGKGLQDDSFEKMSYDKAK
jgi:hypothetical protein